MFHTAAARPRAGTRRRGRAFTLLELIVVVIIIAVLAAFAMVGYDRYVDTSKWTALHASAVQLDRAITARTASTDLTPREEVAAALAAGSQVADGGVAAQSLESYFRFDGYGAVLTVDDATAPTKVQVSRWSRSTCLFLGDEPGEQGRIARGACAAATDPGPGGTDPGNLGDPSGGGDGGDGDGSLAAPTGLAANGGPGLYTVSLTWAPVPGATGYHVYVDGDTTTPRLSVTDPAAAVRGLQVGATAPPARSRTAWPRRWRPRR